MTLDEIKKQIFVDSEEVCGDTMIDTYLAQEYVEQAYNKAIDDFVNACKEDISCQTFGLHIKGIERIAEQLKSGGENENYNKEES